MGGLAPMACLMFYRGQQQLESQKRVIYTCNPDIQAPCYYA